MTTQQELMSQIKTQLQSTLQKGGDTKSSINTFLNRAIANNHPEIVEFLIVIGVDPNFKDNTVFGYTPLHRAVLNKYPKIVKLLLEKGANPNIQNNFLETPLHIAVNKNNADIVELLLDNGAYINIPDRNTNTPVQIAVDENNVKLVQLLLAKGVPKGVDTKSSFNTLLNRAIGRNHPKIVEFFLDNGADPNNQDNFGFTPLHKAVINKYANIVKLLLEKGADPNKDNILKETPLHIAVKKNYVEIVQLLLQNGAKIYDEHIISLATDPNKQTVKKILLMQQINKRSAKSGGGGQTASVAQGGRRNSSTTPSGSTTDLNQGQGRQGGRRGSTTGLNQEQYPAQVLFSSHGQTHAKRNPSIAQNASPGSFTPSGLRRNGGGQELSQEQRDQLLDNVLKQIPIKNILKQQMTKRNPTSAGDSIKVPKPEKHVSSHHSLTGSNRRRGSLTSSSLSSNGGQGQEGQRDKLLDNVLNQIIQSEKISKQKKRIATSAGGQGQIVSDIKLRGQGTGSTNTTVSQTHAQGQVPKSPQQTIIQYFKNRDNTTLPALLVKKQLLDLTKLNSENLRPIILKLYQKNQIGNNNKLWYHFINRYLWNQKEIAWIKRIKPFFTILSEKLRKNKSQQTTKKEALLREKLRQISNISQNIDVKTYAQLLTQLKNLI